MASSPDLSALEDRTPQAIAGTFARAVRSGEWDYSAVRPLRRLRTLTVGVVGCGHIGAGLARRVGRLGVRLLIQTAVESEATWCSWWLTRLSPEPGNRSAMRASSRSMVSSTRAGCSIPASVS